MKNKCKKCGDIFSLTVEEKSMVNNGEIQMPNICDECSDMDTQEEIYEFSDADSGL